MKPMLRPPGSKRLKLNVMYCLQLCVSKSTCAGTPWHTTRTTRRSSPPPRPTASESHHTRFRVYERLKLRPRLVNVAMSAPWGSMNVS